jgi:hypothetical protein
VALPKGLDWEPPVWLHVAPFHEEYSKFGEWPRDCDVPAATRRLAHAFELSRCNAWGCRLGATTMEMTPTMLAKRFGGNLSKEVVEWYTGARPGDIMRTWHADYGAAHRNRFSFSNTCNRPGVLTRGREHVGVGFVDLGFLRTCCRLEGLPLDGPVRWRGYEMSAYCVAKTRVIAAMAADPAVPVEAIVQVWRCVAEWWCVAVVCMVAAYGVGRGVVGRGWFQRHRPPHTIHDVVSPRGV